MHLKSRVKGIFMLMEKAVIGAELPGARKNKEGSDHVQATNTTLISMHGVKKNYRQGRVNVEALRGVDLEIQKGEMLAICGPSGSGKSTLLNIVGLLDDPTSGDVRVSGKSLNTISARQRADMRTDFIGFIFQNFNLIPVLTAHENVMLPLNLQGNDSREGMERARELLNAVGLTQQINAYPDRMSGGQRQRVAIARAMINNPRLIIADEPTANLDTETSIKVMELIAKLQSEKGCTFVFSTHDERILRYMSRVIHLRDGLIENRSA
jgi:putative ABC transport system ATP-binding protein